MSNLNESGIRLTSTPQDSDMSDNIIESPRWMDDTEWNKESLTDLCTGGCASGCYMPAVTYYQARQTMAEHGDDVLQFIEDSYGELPQPNKGESWSGIAVHYLSLAVELWAHSALAEMDDES